MAATMVLNNSYDIKKGSNFYVERSAYTIERVLSKGDFFMVLKLVGLRGGVRWIGFKVDGTFYFKDSVGRLLRSGRTKDIFESDAQLSDMNQ